MLQRKSDIAIRASCRDCGTPMFMTYYAVPDTISIAAGTVDEESMKGRILKPNVHIFVGEKAEWYSLPDDGLKRYEAFPTGLTDALETWNQQVNRK